MEDGKCNECGASASKKCAGCGSVYYCCIEHQKADWTSHRPFCKLHKEKQQVCSHPKAHIEEKDCYHKKKQTISDKPKEPLLDQELKAGESVGTFRWKDITLLQQLPTFKPYMLSSYSTRWQEYIAIRLEECVKDKTLSVQPITVDALSWPMTIVNCLSILNVKSEFLNKLIATKTRLQIVVMGATAKAEERIYCASKGYFEEVINYFPNLFLTYHFVGPQISKELHSKQFLSNHKVHAIFYKGTVGQYLQSLDKPLSVHETLFIGFNPGFGCGFAKLAWSWTKDIFKLLQQKYYTVFTQANDFEDVKGESRILKQILGAKFLQQPGENPFRALSYLHEPGAKDTRWMCANSFYYILQGFKTKEPDLDSIESKVEQIASELKK